MNRLSTLNARQVQLFSVVATLSQIALGYVKPFFLVNGLRLRTSQHSIKL